MQRLKRIREAITTRKNSELSIMDNPMDWLKSYQNEFLSHFENTGEINWKLYPRVRNPLAPGGKGISLTDSRIMLITTSGAYLKHSQPPFDAANKLGDYSVRTFPSDTPFENIAYAHDHYDHQYVDSDPQSLLPLNHLHNLATQGFIGEVAPSVVSFSGYQPNVLRVVKEVIPAVLDVARDHDIDGVLIVPA